MNTTTLRIATVIQRIYALCDMDPDMVLTFADVFPLQDQSLSALQTWLSQAQIRALNDATYEAVFIATLEAGLSILAQSDAFGTEGQLDPRGDAREGTWSMHCVQGLD